MDPYAVLGIGPDASAKDVAVAYRRLAKRFHPDRAGERGARRMAEINAAYDQLRDVHAPAEPVELVVGASTWASPHTLLAVSDRRLLWLLDDAVSHRVRYVDFSSIDAVDHRLAWPRKRTAALRVDLHNGRRLTFADLRPETAAAIALHIRERIRPRTAPT